MGGEAAAKRKVRALGLVSGGLDSMLALCVLREQGIEVAGICFVSHFFSAAKAEAAARQLGFPLLVRDITDAHLAMVKAPASGYGSRMNPCIDCHALMLQIAGTVMAEEGYDFLFTGEVLGERPMSQTLRALNRVANLSGQQDRVLRPLSARLLRATLPEREGLVDRSRLHDIQGRSRRRQMELVERFGIGEFPTPAGGCLLTDPAFSDRLRDFLLAGPETVPRHIEMLKVGRYFRLRDGVRAIVGRNAEGNRALERLAADGDLLLRTRTVPGPVVLLIGAYGEEDVTLAARLCARYSDGRSSRVPVSVRCGSTWSEREAEPIAEDLLKAMRL
jgi:tRNA U34 2-thiouridine synthase MnmA/TrmU